MTRRSKRIPLWAFLLFAFGLFASAGMSFSYAGNEDSGLSGLLIELLVEGRPPQYFLYTNESVMPLLFDDTLPSDAAGRWVSVRGVQPAPGEPFHVRSLDSYGEIQPLDVSGEQRTMVVLVKFNDIPETTYSSPHFEQLVGVDMKNFYLEASFSSTSFVVSVTDKWYTLPMEKSWYIDDNGECRDVRCLTLISDGVGAADSDVNYSLFDRVFIVPNSDFRAYSLSSSFPFLTNEGFRWLTISAVPETDPVGNFAHGMGHQLGLPDLYDYSFSQRFVDSWGLMAQGSSNGPSYDGSSPAHPVSWSKLELGWISPSHVYEVDLSVVTELTLIPLEFDADSFGPSAVQVARIPVGTNYYLIEVRRSSGFDSYLPGEGVLISYIDESLGSGYGIVRVQPSGSPAAYSVGASFSDSINDVVIDVQSTDGVSYSIRVSSSYLPTRDAYFVGVRVTDGFSWVDLVGGGVARVYSGQAPAWINLTVYNDAVGLYGASLFTRFYLDSSEPQDSGEQWMVKGSSFEWEWYWSAGLTGPTTVSVAVEVWWNDGAQLRLQDRLSFQIRVVRLWVEDWYSSDLSLLTDGSSAQLYVTYTNAGNDYMYNVELEVVDSQGLVVSPATRGLGDLAGGRRASMWFAVSAPPGLLEGDHQISFRVSYDDFRAVTHVERQIAPFAVIPPTILIDNVWVTDERADVGSVQYVYLHVSWRHDQTPVTSGTIYVNGQPYFPNASGWTVVQHSQENVIQMTWTVTAVDVGGIANFEMLVDNPSIIWDRIRVTELWVSGSRASRASVQRIHARAVYEYDGMPFTGSGTLYLNGTGLSYDATDALWYLDVTNPTVARLTYQISSVWDDVYDLTALLDPLGPTSIVWDSIECYYLELGDERVNVGENIEFRARCRLSYDDHELGASDFLATDFGSLTWDETDGWFEIRRTQSSVGDYTFAVLDGFEATFGITALYIAVPEPTGIWDRVECYYEEVDDYRVSVGSNIELRVRCRLQFDSHELGPNDTVEAGFGPLAWDPSNSWFDGQRTQNTVGSYAFSVSSVYERTYGITALLESASSLTGIYDRIRVSNLQAEDTRIDVGSEAVIFLAGELEFDGHPLAPEDIVACDGLSLPWEADGSLFVGRESKLSVQSKSYDFCSISEATYGITAVNMDGKRATVIWDRVAVSEGGAMDPRINVGTSTIVWFIAGYEYDGFPLDESSSLMVNGESAAWIVEAGRWEVSSGTSQEVGSAEFRVTSMTDSAYGLTALHDEVGAQTVIWDRVTVFLEATRRRIDVGSQADIEIESAYAFDGMPFDGEVLLSPDLTQDSVGSYVYTVESISDGTHGVMVFQSNTVEVIFDRVGIQLSAEDSRINANTSAVVVWTAIYEYDDAPFQGSVSLNNPLTRSDVGASTYAVQSISDDLYGLTTFASNQVQVVFDEVSIELTLADDRIDAGSTAQVLVQAVYMYDGESYDGEVLLAGELTHSDVGEYLYEVASIAGDTYGITVFEANSVSVVFDKVLIQLSAVDSRTDVGSTAQILVEASYAYDGTSYVGTVTLNDTLTKDVRGAYVYTAESIGGDAHRISVFESNAVTVTFAAPEKPMPVDWTPYLVVGVVTILYLALLVVLIKRRS